MIHRWEESPKPYVRTAAQEKREEVIKELRDFQREGTPGWRTLKSTLSALTNGDEIRSTVKPLGRDHVVLRFYYQTGLAGEGETGSNASISLPTSAFGAIQGIESSLKEAEFRVVNPKYTKSASSENTGYETPLRGGP